MLNYMSNLALMLSTDEIAKWKSVYGRGIIVLPGGNFFRPGQGYLTEHIPVHLRRDLPDHWDGLLTDNAPFEKSWKPRSGPLELIFNLAKCNGNKRFSVLNMGGGTGDFTIDLARIPNVFVTHVDFSLTANRIASGKISTFGLDKKVKVVTADNKEFLKKLASKEQADFVFFYGSVAENLPNEKDVVDTLLAGAQCIKDGGCVYQVMLVQPRITDPRDERATDIMGEYPARITLISEMLSQHPELHLVQEDINSRPDSHPLEQGGVSVPHMHVIQRILLVKNSNGKHIPKFGFKDALSPNWPETWRGIITGS